LTNVAVKYNDYLGGYVMKRGTDNMIHEYLASIGRKGGRARAKKYDKATLSKWAKRGGRPRKKGEKA
jgi:general stress protein YciG